MAEYWSHYRVQEIQKFQESKDCCVLLLSSDGAVGLDLHFVTHLILLDEIFDRSVEDQVIARAWRLGNDHPVIVERLMLENSVEHILHKLNHCNEQKRSESLKLCSVSPPVMSPSQLSPSPIFSQVRSYPSQKKSQNKPQLNASVICLLHFNVKI